MTLFLIMFAATLLSLAGALDANKNSKTFFGMKLKYTR